MLRRALALLLCLTATAAAAPPPGAVEHFEKHVRPVLVEHCYRCHGPKRQQAGLRLDSKTDFLRGSDNGPVLDPKAPEKSSFLRVLAHDGDVKMPPKGKLPSDLLEPLTAWVKSGAPWPESATPSTTTTIRPAEVRKTHWSFRPVTRPAVPAVKDSAWPAGDVDRFVLARLEAKGLSPSPEADRRTLLRRLSFDLTGLPPTPEELAAFEADPSPDAYAKQVDRLLSSPHYGERWGRYWLDVARYADTRGYVFMAERRFAYSWTYRDWVVRAFNEDLPYDQFVLQQLAADRLDLGEDKRPLAAMGFLTLGRRFLNNVHDIIDDRIDVTMRGLQGLTVSCARCHDHKYDPIPTRDYYSLYGVFASSVEPDRPPVIESPRTTPQASAYRTELERLEKDVADYKQKFAKELGERNRKHRNELSALQRKVDKLRVTHPGAPAGAMVLQDAPRPTEPVVFVRGNPGNRGDAVPRRFLEVLSDDQPRPFRDGSGRLELARAIVSRDNPLTARVMVNRVWMHHFGHGLVRTPSDFGLRGEAPTHPELLDWLASEFMGPASGGRQPAGWSVKHLHRLILLSRAYRQASDDRADALAADPENRLLWKMNRRRLDFEAQRDALLAVAGRLDRGAGGPSVDILAAPFSGRRTLYGFIDRQNLPGVFRTFDLASPDAHTPKRHSTTVPQQSLYLMNSPFVQAQARALAERPDVAGLPTSAKKIEALHRLLYQRRPDAEETALGLAFVDEAAKAAPTGMGPWAQYAQVLLLANEFVFVD